MTLDALGPMLRERLGLALSRARLRAVLERSEGNPLHALELGRLVLSGASLTPGEAARVPATLGGLVAQRVRGLDGRTRRALLEVAALSRPSMELLDATGDELETAVTAGLVERSGDAVRFSHPLYASAIYTAATADERRRVHGDLAARVTDPAERALHLALGADGPDDRLAAHLEEVAGEVSERGRPTRRRSWPGRRAGSRPTTTVPTGPGAAWPPRTTSLRRATGRRHRRCWTR